MVLVILPFFEDIDYGGLAANDGDACAPRGRSFDVALRGVYLTFNERKLEGALDPKADRVAGNALNLRLGNERNSGRPPGRVKDVFVNPLGALICHHDLERNSAYFQVTPPLRRCGMLSYYVT